MLNATKPAIFTDTVRLRYKPHGLKAQSIRIGLHSLFNARSTLHLTRINRPLTFSKEYRLQIEID